LKVEVSQESPKNR